MGLLRTPILLFILIIAFSFVLSDDVQLKEEVVGESYQAEADLDQKSIY